MEAGNQDLAASLMTAALSFYEAASQLNGSDIKLMVRLNLHCLAFESVYPMCGVDRSNMQNCALVLPTAYYFLPLTAD